MQDTFTFGFVDIISKKMPREGVVVVAEERYGSLLLETYRNNGKLFVNFFVDEIQMGEDRQKAARRLLRQRAIIPKKMKYLGNFFPEDSSYEEVHIYVASVDWMYLDERIFTADTVRILEFIEKKVFIQPESIGAYYRFLSYHKGY